MVLGDELNYQEFLRERFEIKNGIQKYWKFVLENNRKDEMYF